MMPMAEAGLDFRVLGVLPQTPKNFRENEMRVSLGSSNDFGDTLCVIVFHVKLR